IPAFYSCYLLRSTVSRTSHYIGSTPNIHRRLQQHNGLSKGGAVRTSRESLRPWEVACIVHGFPSQVAALQFEWAWQHPHLTRHISEDNRITTAKSKPAGPDGTRTRKKPPAPRISINARVHNLHLLLRSKTFERMPLAVGFFCEDVHTMWTKWSKKASGAPRSGITVTLYEPPDTPSSRAGALDPPPTALSQIDVTYAHIKPYLEKTRALLTPDMNCRCSVCRKKMEASESLLLVCPHDGCVAVSHLSCLSSHFLGEDEFVPIGGDCPSCNSHTSWGLLAKELSLRTRGQSLVEELFKPPRVRAKAKTSEKTPMPDVDSEE
ncbi:hypothetical protein EJ06DRAFT_459506, partial [Trichodelitschia bisporula]